MGAPAPPRAWPGDCLICGNYKQQVRHVETPGHPRIQACFDCRPGDAPPPVRKFAVVVRDQHSYLIEASSREEAEVFLHDELYALNEDLLDERSSVKWEAANHFAWLAAWRRGDVTVIRDRRLPEGLE